VERILTQSEIDELLSAFEGGEIDVRLKSDEGDNSPHYSHDSKIVSDIDLTKGQNYSKWRIANLDIVFNAFARYYSISLSNNLQRSVVIHKREIVSKFFEDFLSDLDNVGVLGVFSLDPLKGNGLFVFDKNLCFCFVEMLFGVSPESAFVVPDRELTAIEANVIRSLMTEGCFILNRAFDPLDQLSSKITRVETNWKQLNILSPETEVIQINFSVQLGDFKKDIMMVIPYFSLEPFRERFRGKGFQLSENIKESNWAKRLEKEAMNMEVSISANLGELYLTIQEILDLNTEDIITFDYDKEAPIKVMVNRKPKFTAQPGISNGKKAVRLLKQDFSGEQI
jgi:flagellar motor switch protein FliM